MAITFATDVSPIVFDLETAPLADVAQYLDPPDLTDIQAPSNYVKPEAIAAYVERERAKRLTEFAERCASSAALDPNCARIVALGWWTQTEAEYRPLRTEAEEAQAIAVFWKRAQHRTLVGFRIRELDLPMLIQRSRYLDVAHPALDLGRYTRGASIDDLYDLLTFHDARGERVMRRGLTAFARRFGLPVTDTIRGEDIPALVAAGDWEAVVSHVQADVALTVALARRLRVIHDEDAR